MKTKYAYMAGMLDGEGYIGLAKLNQSRYTKKWTYKARVIVSNCNLQVLDWIKKNFGGYICKKTSPTNPKHTQGYNLTIGYHEKWIPKVIPYMVGKKKKAQLLLEATKLLDQRRKKTNQAKDLNLIRLAEIDNLLSQKEWLI